MGSRRNCSNGGIFEKNELKIYSELPVFMEMIVFYICIASGSLTADGGGDFTCFSDGNFKFCRLWTYQKALGVLSTSDLLCDKVTSQKIQFHSDRIEELPAFLDLLRLCGNRIEVLTDYLITVDPLIGGLEDSLEILCLKVYSTTSLSLTRLLVAIYEEIHTNDKDWWMSSSYGRLLCSSLAKLKRLRLGEKKEKFDGITTDCCEVLGEFFTAGIPLLSALQWGFNQE